MTFLSITFSVTRSVAQYYLSIDLCEYKTAPYLPPKTRKITQRRITIASSKNIVDELDVSFASVNHSINQQPSTSSSSHTTSAPTPPNLPNVSSLVPKNKNLQIFNTFNPFQTINKAPFVLRQKRLASL